MKFVNGVNVSNDCEHCCPSWQCVMQADEVPIQAESSTSYKDQETTQFLDEESGVDVGSAAEVTSYDISDAVIDAGLTQFLSRPVRIANFTWNESDPVATTTTISPWNAFFNNANIKYKLNNFAFVRANLKIKIVVNASPFYYGSMRASYQPLPAFKASTVVAGTSGSQANSELIPYSQQPGVWIKPQHSEGAEMVLPYFWPKSFIRAQVAQDFTDLGTLRLIVYNVLKSANGVTGTGVTVQVYAWAEDVYLAGPSVGLAMQADEYGIGPVSGPASTVANIAEKLKGIPVIGKFAVATEMGARAVAGIAKLFGWTNVPVIDPAMPMRPTAFPQLASPEIGFPTEKLTLDSKNELSVDPSVLGLPAHDELAIQSFATRESFVVSTNWSTSTPIDTPLFTTRVTPSIVPSVASSMGALCQFPPVAFVAQLFSAWRGDIIFTFRFIASPFHKGRVRISYDPYNSAVQTTADTGAVVFNKIVDLAAETEVDIRVPYQQALAWCNTSFSGTVYTTSSTPTLTFQESYDNGMLSMKVLTALSAPVATSDVDIQVFVRAAENIEFANPKPVLPFSPFAMQAAEYSESVGGVVAPVGENKADLDTVRNRVYMGEQVRSLRPLLRRSNFVDAIVPTPNTTNLGVYYVSQRRFPLPWGYDPNGWNSAKGVTAPSSNFAINFVANTPYNMISNCFIGQKGAAHWHYNWQGPTSQSMRLIRYPVTGGASKGYSGNAVGTSSANTQTLVQNMGITTAAGLALTNQLTNAGLSVSLPNYTVYKFQTTDPTKSMNGTALDGSNREMFYLQILNNGTVDDLSRGRLERYFGVGTDFSLYFFLNCPSLYYYTYDSMVAN